MQAFSYFFTIFLFFSVESNVAGQYYVSPAGSDTYPGTRAMPFRSIQKAAGIMHAGDTCYIMEGKYRETVIPAGDGQKGKPLVFTNYADDRVVILGSEEVNVKWERYKQNIYKAYFPEKVLQLFVDKKRALPARYPDLNGDKILDIAGWKPVNAKVNGDAVFKDMNFPEDYWKGGYCQVLTGRKWIAHLGKISSSNGDTVHCDERSYPWGDYNPPTYLGEGVGYIMFHLHALDSPNEWHWQNDTLYYFVSGDKNIEELQFEARTRLYGFDCKGKDYINIENVSFVWASINFGNATNCVLEDCNVLYPTPFYSYTNGWCRNKVGGDNFSIDKWDGKGIHVSGFNNKIKNCYIAHSWGDGVSIGGIGNILENCIIEDCDWSATDAAPVCASGRNHLIIHNTIHGAARSVLVHRLCDSTDIKFNEMYDSGIMCSDLGLTYSYHTNGGGSEIAYNWVHNNNADGAAFGIYLDNYDTSYVVHHNVIWDCQHAIQTNKPAIDHKIYNNTVWHCKKTIGTWGKAGTEIINQEVKNNLSDKTWNTGTYFANNLTTRNPEFQDPAKKDFSLKANSPAIDFGVVLPGITDGYHGLAPDAGAYEYGADKWVSGSTVAIPDLSDIVLPKTK